MVELAVLHQPPELHLVHDVGVVQTLLVAQTAVVVVDLPQAADVPHHHVHHLIYLILLIRLSELGHQVVNIQLEARAECVPTVIAVNGYIVWK